MLLKVKFIDQRVKINPRSSKTKKLITLKNCIIMSFNKSDAYARN